MRWTSAFVYLSAAVLVAAVIGKLTGWPAAATEWLLLAWTILLLPLARALFRHPMRYPAWGLFLGFWASLGVVTLIVLQSLAVADVLREPSRTFAESWPLAVFGVWALVTCLLGTGGEVEVALPAPVEILGAVAGAALVASGIVVWAGLTGSVRPAFFAAAVAFVAWTAALSGELWSWRLSRVAAPPAGQPAAAAAALEPVPVPAAP